MIMMDDRRSTLGRRSICGWILDGTGGEGGQEKTTAWPKRRGSSSSSKSKFTIHTPYVDDDDDDDGDLTCINRHR